MLRLPAEALNRQVLLMENEQSQNIQPMHWTTGELLQATEGSLVCGDSRRVFDRISIDSRSIAAGNLFVAIPGKVHDGHRFIGDVISQGIGGILVQNEKLSELGTSRWNRTGIVCIGVKDTIRALGNLAAFHRRRSAASVVAITGSNGKTTTREMTAAVLSQSFCVMSTSGNLNNDIGMPLTLLKLNPAHQWAVLELGMNHPGEIRRLTEICSPDIGIITNIGPAHLEGLGSLDGVMRAKGELLQTMDPEKKVILNADDQRVMKLARDAVQNVTLFGKTAGATVTARDIVQDAAGTRFTLCLPGAEATVKLGIIGDFMVSNALAAAAAGHLLDLPVGQIKAGLEAFRPVQGRMNIYRSPERIHIIDDTYNANPGSMQAAIRTLNLLSRGNRGVLVAGDMLELGENAESLHAEMGALAARSKLSRICLTGQYGQAISSGAQAEGMPLSDIFIGSKEDVLRHLSTWLAPGDWVLIKGSRAMGMEQVVEGLKTRYGVDESAD